MERPTQPGDIAREAIRRLASRGQAPPPENFIRACAEVEGREPAAADWPNILRAPMRQWDACQTGPTQARKREMPERVIIDFGAQPEQLAVRIANLAKSWGESAGAAGVAVQGSPPSAEAVAVADSAQRRGIPHPAAQHAIGRGGEGHAAGAARTDTALFMHENQRVLVTFSAGVVQLAPGEEREGVIARADAAMYRAKTGGRNLVERG